MQAEEALQFVEDTLVRQGKKRLTDFQRAVFRGSWDDRNYKELPRLYRLSCTWDFLQRDVGPELWQLLTTLLGEKVTKKNLRGPVERRFEASLRRNEAALEQKQSQLVIKRQRHRAQYFVEDLGKGVTLDMVLIPAGNFIMGSPPDELEHNESEGPQHPVTLQTFFLGRYAVTQAQWRAIAALPQINRELEPDPSRFKGDDCPVERIIWFDAVEFCDRLSRHTNRKYRLPSESEWEYACRAGTTTPFHFGETITTDVANYRGTDNEKYKWSGSYGQGPKGIYRQETTPVGSFAVANAFGLYDMHGNVWEWCVDHWHDNYEGAPKDGSAWVTGGDKDRRLLRGGSWSNFPLNCRSAFRHWSFAADGYNDSGFRVVCSA